MGQTLTHGVYLPDEGERNCYAGLAANWQILDTSVGTIAAHTAALSGKAPLVHTHTKSDITDFPAYGNAAGTICEGNDSRLSDARTPVAHTHGKADVTDLLNSNFIPSTNNTYDLGSSSYQWNNLYAKNYYYNGVAWGLNKANQWTKTQDFVGENQGTESSVNYRTCFAMYGRLDTVGKSGMFFTKYRPNRGQGSLISTDIIQCGVDALENEVRTNNAFLLQVSGYDSNTNKFTKLDILSALPNANLGNSSNKWKNLNGINPGALSLPVTALNNTYDISGDITDLTGGNNSITAARTGWIFVKSDNATEISVENTTTGMGASDHSASATTLMVSIPVTSGETLNIIANCTSIDKAYLLPCQGNV